jgi:predicted transcriptional regulator
MQGPIKVSQETKERVRYAAALTGSSQSELVSQAVDEYVARHGAELAEGINQARLALARGTNATVAHILGVPEEQIDRIAGG